MDALNSFISSLGVFANIDVWGFILLGVIIGLVFGILPGVSGLTAMSILLPFIFNMPPEFALSLFVAICSLSATGGSITAILLNIPGDTVNAATLVDGFPMTQKGAGGRALGAALWGSLMGSMLSVAMCILIVPVILPIIYAMTSGDMVFVILMAFTCISSISGKSQIKGWIACFTGVLLSFVGSHVITGVSRYSMGTVYLLSGVPIVAVALGLFAMTEMIDLAAKGGTIAKKNIVSVTLKQVLEGCKDVFRHWTVWIRSSIIGFIIGVIPGVGSATSTWMAYGQAKQTSKHPELFGSGSVEGVIAPEVSNGATVSGDLLTTIVLGIPGSVTMVLILGALMILGIRPGPEMITDHLPLSLSIIQVYFVAKVIGTLVCILLAAKLVSIAVMPSNILVPLTIAVIFIGTYAPDARLLDLVTLLVFMGIGLLMREFGFSVPALIIGFILGDTLEKYATIAYSWDGPLFFVRPISLVLIVISLIFMFYSPLSKLVRLRLKKANTER